MDHAIFVLFSELTVSYSKRYVAVDCWRMNAYTNHNEYPQLLVNEYFNKLGNMLGRHTHAHIYIHGVILEEL